MQLIAIASAKGGSARTTACVRLAQALQAAGVPTGIVDLSPYPSVQFLVGKGDKIPIINGRGATTPIAARSVIRPYEERCSVLLMDTSRLDDPGMLPWLPMLTHSILTLKLDKNSVAAIPSIWDALEVWKSANARIQFLGFLPVCVEDNQRATLQRLRGQLKEYILPGAIPWNESERLGPDLATRGSEWDELAERLRVNLGLKVVAPEGTTKPEKGLISRMWKLASAVLGPRATVEGASR